MNRLLLVEDEEALREIICAELNSWFVGLTIVEARSGFEAIEILKQTKEFAIIVSDYGMENGSGFDLLRFLGLNKYHIPFILHTSNLNPVLPKEVGDFFVGVTTKMDFDTLNLQLSKILV